MGHGRDRRPSALEINTWEADAPQMSYSRSLSYLFTDVHQTPGLVFRESRKAARFAVCIR